MKPEGCGWWRVGPYWIADGLSSNATADIPDKLEEEEEEDDDDDEEEEEEEEEEEDEEEEEGGTISM